ncbi:IS66 family transposase [Roseateles sp.]|uniref:IS66 family transposase n=1 Tax=Roseateles sp. TaxID=1971397 RepID=UPI003BAB1335
MYKVEADARRDDLDVHALQQQRTRHSKPVLEQIEALALRHLHGVLPGSLLGKALHYLTAQWPTLVRYADDGRYPIVSVRRTHLELRLRGDNDPVQLTNSWTRWIRRIVVSAGATAQS